eukprot:TRINITY_DN10550_c0_g1_i3.p1 TRINITY_DN10550_c0_g1~~TRINITY_DN10550_c0_g1_i3.p1  ORF type:complete len:667 (+),score=92.41 TRINITY_DN10550_c0_g1_i3:70-2001(+)
MVFDMLAEAFRTYAAPDNVEVDDISSRLRAPVEEYLQKRSAAWRTKMSAGASPLQREALANMSEADISCNLLDINGKGFLEYGELIEFLRECSVSYEAVSDSEVLRLCSHLDPKAHGHVDIRQFLLLVNPQMAPRKNLRRGAGETTLLLAEARLRDDDGALSCFGGSRAGGNRALQPPTRKVAPRQLRPENIEHLRSRLKAAAYMAGGGRQLGIMLRRLDTKRTGVLRPDDLRQILRRTCKVTPSAISDDEIWGLCAMLDKTGSGVVTLEALLAFIGRDPTVSKRTGKRLSAAAVASAGFSAEDALDLDSSDALLEAQDSSEMQASLGHGHRHPKAALRRPPKPVSYKVPGRHGEIGMAPSRKPLHLTGAMVPGKHRARESLKKTLEGGRVLALFEARQLKEDDEYDEVMETSPLAMGRKSLAMNHPGAIEVSQRLRILEGLSDEWDDRCSAAGYAAYALQRAQADLAAELGRADVLTRDSEGVVLRSAANELQMSMDAECKEAEAAWTALNSSVTGKERARERYENELIEMVNELASLRKDAFELKESLWDQSRLQSELRAELAELKQSHGQCMQRNSKKERSSSPSLLQSELRESDLPSSDLVAFVLRNAYSAAAVQTPGGPKKRQSAKWQKSSTSEQAML